MKENPLLCKFIEVASKNKHEYAHTSKGIKSLFLWKKVRDDFEVVQFPLNLSKYIFRSKSLKKKNMQNFYKMQIYTSICFQKHENKTQLLQSVTERHPFSNGKKK